MNRVSRRDFFSRSAQGVGIAGGLVAGIRGLRGDPLGMPIGCQVYPVRDALGKDFEGTLREIAALGYQTIEMCSPPGYAAAGFGPLVNLKATEMRKTIQAAGLRCQSCHYGFRELKESLDDRIAFAKELGLTQMVLSTFGLPKEATLDDWTRAATELNRIAEKTQKAGIQMGFHNHDFEFREVGGTLIYDHLMRSVDPKLVKMQFQVAVISLGYQAATFFDKYPGRFLSMHLADWSAAEKKPVPVGSGAVNWKQLFTAAKTGGVKNYFVEMDLDAMKASYAYLHQLQV